VKRPPPRFDQPSLVDAAVLIWGLAGFALIKLGGRLMKAADDNLDVWGNES
jgi:hypothetical protein